MNANEIDTAITKAHEKAKVLTTSECNELVFKFLKEHDKSFMVLIADNLDTEPKDGYSFVASMSVKPAKTSATLTFLTRFCDVVTEGAFPTEILRLINLTLLFTEDKENKKDKKDS